MDVLTRRGEGQGQGSESEGRREVGQGASVGRARRGDVSPAALRAPEGHTGLQPRC